MLFACAFEQLHESCAMLPDIHVIVIVGVDRAMPREPRLNRSGVTHNDHGGGSSPSNVYTHLVLNLYRFLGIEW